MNWDVMVVGGGISGLSAAFEAKKRGRRVLLLEASSQCGGVLQTYRDRDGCLLEEGAESMLASKPAARQLCEELGIADQLIGTQPEYRATFVVRGGKLESVPQGFRLMAPQEILPFLRSPIFSWWGKLRMGLEWFVPPRRELADESLGQFVRRRFGSECLERMAQPMAAGIYTADPEHLSMQAALPEFLELERRYGSVLKGFRRRPSSAQGPRYALFQTLRQGMAELPRRLADSLGPEIVRYDSPVDEVAAAPGGWVVRSGEETYTAEKLVLALPAPASARLARTSVPGLAADLAQIRYLSSATVNLVYSLSQISHGTRAYGFVVPVVEDRSILACTFSHRKYAERCGADSAVLRTYVGGASNPAALDWSDEQLIFRSHADLSDLLGIRGEPTAAHVARWPASMPVYEVGHLSRVARIERFVRETPGLGLTGNFLRGVGIPDCIGQARACVAALLA